MPRKSACAVLFATALILAAAVTTRAEDYTSAERRHWSFRPRGNPSVPVFESAADRAWIRNPIDAFILAALKKEHLAPAPKADRATLIRRVTYDLTGLPPAPAEVAAFVRDESPDAYPKLIDRLLDSPQYGERWGQHWLDVVRYAETDGFEYDTHRHDAWRYRDYVIRSFNRDKPYDQFIREQLAGDEISAIDEEMRVAAGFNRLGPLRKNAGNQDVTSSRNEVLTEMTNVVGAALLGVTLGCARCHDHKFDPIRQKDYYRIQAYFAAAHEKDVPLAGAGEQAEWKAKAEPIEKEIKALKKAMGEARSEQAKAEFGRKIEAVEAQLPEALPALFSVADDPVDITPIHVLARGDYQSKGESVAPRPLGVLLPEGAPEPPRGTTVLRNQLAGWILAPDNPLTARVIVNRVWQYHFGRGIVATPNDFGRMGERPSHPELLDYLANEFIASGWRFKALHRMILLSNAYQQSFQSPSAKMAQEKDPNNKLLWHFERRRLEAEEIRDSALAIAGALNPKPGGPSVIVPVDPDLLKQLYKPAQWKVTRDEEEHNRRSIYLIAKRNFRLPIMEVFDAPDYQLSCARRESSTHAPQALELLNGAFTNRMARVFADRLQREAGPSKTGAIDLAYRLVAGRGPNAREKRLAADFLKTQPLSEFALAMLNLNAFLYLE